MGRDKATLEIGGVPLFRLAAEALAWTDRRVQAGGSPLPDLEWETVPDRDPGGGPALALATLLERYPRTAVVVRAVDLPGADARLLRATLRMAAEADAGCTVVAPRHDGLWHPLAATWLPAARRPLERWLASGRRDLQRLLDEMAALPLEGEALSTLGDPAFLLANVNTPEELERARARGLRPRTSPDARRGRE